MKRDRYTFKVHKEGKGYWAECIQLSGCQTQADNLTELKKNIKEVLSLYLETQRELLESKKVIKLPRQTGSFDIYAVN